MSKPLQRLTCVDDDAASFECGKWIGGANVSHYGAYSAVSMIDQRLPNESIGVANRIRGP